jgi:hypothetical protein
VEADTSARRRRLPELIRDIGSNLSLLARQQAELAKRELAATLGEKAKGAALLAVAGVLGLFVIGFLGIAGAAALDLVLPRWAALLIVAGVFLLLAAIAGLVGKGALAAAMTPELTKRTVKEDVEWARAQIRR